MARPRLQSAVASGAQVTVTFDQPIDTTDGKMALATSYSIPGLVVTGVTGVVGPSDATAVLAVYPETRTGKAYSLTVAPDLKNVGAEEMDPAFKTVAFTGVGVAPIVSAAVMLRPGLLRVTFSEPMQDDAALADTDSYSLSVVTAGAALAFVTAVRVGNDPRPRFVDLEITDTTTGATYQVTTTGLSDAAGNPMAGPSFTTFAGAGVTPVVLAIVPVDANTVDVRFAAPMLDNADVRLVTHYIFDNGLTVSEVLSVQSDTVRLRTSDQTPGTLYTLSFS